MTSSCQKRLQDWRGNQGRCAWDDADSGRQVCNTCIPGCTQVHEQVDVSDGVRSPDQLLTRLTQRHRNVLLQCRQPRLHNSRQLATAYSHIYSSSDVFPSPVRINWGGTPYPTSGRPEEETLIVLKLTVTVPVTPSKLTVWFEPFCHHFLSSFS